MSKRNGKKMKLSSSVEEFREEFDIPLSIGLRFVEEEDVDLAEGSRIEGELFLSKGYFEVGLSLALPPFA